MDRLDETDVMLEDHINKCRCCFRMLIDDQKSIRISKSIEQKFFELTQIKVGNLIEYQQVTNFINLLAHRYRNILIKNLPTL